MSRVGITYQDVAQAALKAQGLGCPPTIDRIREMLGTGSKSTIAKYLKEWKDRDNSNTLSANIPAELLGLIQGLWDRLHDSANEKIKNYQAETQATLISLQTKLAEEESNHQVVKHQATTLTAKLQESAETVLKQQERLTQEKHKMAALSERNSGLQEQLEARKQEVARLHQLLSHLQTNIEHYQTAIQTLHQEQVLALEKQKMLHDQETTQLKQEASALREGKNELEQALGVVKHELALLHPQFQNVQSKNAELQTKLEEKMVSESRITEQLQAIRLKHEALQHTVELKSDLVVSLEKKLAAATVEINFLNQSTKKALEQASHLEREKAQLSQANVHLTGQIQQLLKQKDAIKGERHNK